MTTPPPRPEVWLRGPVTGMAPSLQPVAHALLQALEELERVTPLVRPDELGEEPGGAASLWFHYIHLAGSLDRLLTYARGEPLSVEQQSRLVLERGTTPPEGTTPNQLLDDVREVIGRAIEQLRDTRESELDTPRPVGRAGYPSSVRGLLFHGAEHTARHVGQIVTTVKILRGAPGLGSDPPPA